MNKASHKKFLHSFLHEIAHFFPTNCVTVLYFIFNHHNIYHIFEISLQCLRSDEQESNAQHLFRSIYSITHIYMTYQASLSNKSSAPAFNIRSAYNEYNISW